MVFLSGYLFYLSVNYGDIIYSVLGLILVILTITFSGKLGRLNNRISFYSPKNLLTRIRNNHTFKLPILRITRSSISLFTKSSPYKIYLGLGLIYLSTRSIISAQYTLHKIIVDQAQSQQNPYSLYLTSVWQQLSKIWHFEVLPLIIFFILGMVIYKRYDIGRDRIFIKSRHHALLTAAFIVILYFIGTLSTIQLSKVLADRDISNISAKLSNVKDARSLNILSNDKEIIESLRKTSYMPKIVGNDDQMAKIIILSLLNRNVSSFYNRVTLPSAISAKKIDLKLPGDILLLPNGTLVIKELNKSSIESMSPVLGRLMVKKYFDSKYIKEEPQIQVMGRQEYLKFREDQINEQLAEISKYVANTQSLINTTYGNISQDKQKITANQSGLSQATSSRESDYQYCKTAGYSSYYFNTFYRYYSDSECESQRQKWDAIIVGFQKNITDWEESLRIDQYNLSEYQKTKDLLTKYRDLIATQKENSPGELGLFESPNKIKVVLESTSDKAIADYFAIVTHEYLHYTSYVSEERTLPQFFEEGLTEHYSRQIIYDQTGTKTNIGYPTIVPIIKKIAKDIPREELERVYFTKDSKLLIALLNQKYGTNFYRDSEYYFNIIPYLNPSDALELVNNIMFKIGGSKLTENELYSTSSSFE